MTWIPLSALPIISYVNFWQVNSTAIVFGFNIRTTGELNEVRHVKFKVGS